MIIRNLTIILLSIFMLASCDVLALDSIQPITVRSDVMLYWSAPTERVNGESMEESEIGGYEIRYRATDSDTFTTIVLTDPNVDQYMLKSVPNAQKATIQVAVFDKDGIYSDFVTATER